METFISILRGINVSGHKKILMADLKELYSSLGFIDCLTYIQSGNVIFKTEKKSVCTDLAIKIENAILAKYKFEVPVLVLKPKELAIALELNPFLHRAGIDPEKLYFTFLANLSATDLIEKIDATVYVPDEFLIIKQTIYLHCPGGYGNTKLSNAFFENKLKVKATTRNLKTVNTLLKMANK